MAESKNSADYILNLELTPVRIRLSSEFLNIPKDAIPGMMNVPAGFLKKEDYEQALQDIQKIAEKHPVWQQALKTQMPLLTQAVVKGRVTGKINLKNPLTQMVWGATLAYLSSNPEEMAKWPQENQSPNGIVESGIWKQVRENPVFQDERFNYATLLASRSMVNNDVSIHWGGTQYPNIGYYFDPQNNLINLDMLWALLGGFEHMRAAVMHEIGHSHGTLMFTPETQKLVDEAAQIEKKDEKTEEDFKRLNKINQEVYMRHMIMDEAENSFANGFAKMLTEKGLVNQNMAQSLSNIETSLLGVGKSILKERAGKSEEKEKTPQAELSNMKKVLRYGFHVNNGLFENTPQAWKEVGVHLDWLTGKDVKGNPMKPEEVVEDLIKKTAQLEALQIPVNLTSSRQRVKDKIQEAFDARAKIIDEIYERYAKDIVARISEQEKEQMKKQMQGQQGQQQQGQGQQSQQGQGQQQSSQGQQQSQQGSGQGQNDKNASGQDNKNNQSGGGGNGQDDKNNKDDKQNGSGGQNGDKQNNSQKTPQSPQEIRIGQKRLPNQQNEKNKNETIQDILNQGLSGENDDDYSQDEDKNGEKQFNQGGEAQGGDNQSRNNTVSHGKGSIYTPNTEVKKIEWTRDSNAYTQIIHKEGNPTKVHRLKVLFERLRNEYYDEKQKFRREILPKSDVMHSLDMRTLRKRLEKMSSGQEVTENDYRQFKNKLLPQPKKAPIDICIFVDISGSMRGAGTDKFAIEIGCLINEAVRSNDAFNVYLGTLGYPTVFLAEPGDGDKAIAQKLSTLYKGGLTRHLHNCAGDELMQAIPETLEKIAKNTRREERSGYTHFLFITDEFACDRYNLNFLPMLKQVLKADNMVSLNWISTRLKGDDDESAFDLLLEDDDVVKKGLHAPMKQNVYDDRDLILPACTKLLEERIKQMVKENAVRGCDKSKVIAETVKKLKQNG